MTFRTRTCAVPLLAALASAGCGGKLPALEETRVLPDGGRTGPVPTCGAICARIIGSCVPGAGTDACVTDCEEAKSRFIATCPTLLDTYLSCMGTTRVECNGDNVVVIDCSNERNQLEACHP